MKMKTVLFTVIASFLLIGGVGCEKEREDKIPPELIGTWKLEGFGDMSDNSFKQPELGNCNTCYTITFYKNSDFEGLIIVNSIIGKYTVSNTEISIKAAQTKIDERNDDADKFSEIFKIGTYQYKLSTSSLVLFYTDTKYISFYRK